MNVAVLAGKSNPKHVFFGSICRRLPCIRTPLANGNEFPCDAAIKERVSGYCRISEEAVCPTKLQKFYRTLSLFRKSFSKASF